MASDQVLTELASAMLKGASIDWTSAESSAVDESTRGVVRNLSVIAAIAAVHGDGSAEEQGDPTTTGTWCGLQLLEKIGEGAFGEVYRASDPRLAREVALKLLRRSDSDHSPSATVAIDEARMLAQVRHPNVVTVYGADRSAGRVGLWMEFIHGRTLEHLVRHEGPLTTTAAMRIGLDLCRALSAVHKAGLVHRDVKAHNVMREDGGRIVLMDFGTGLDRSDDSDGSGRGLAGTPLYMAPEILTGHQATIASDIYGLGVLLYYLVTGSYPVCGSNIREVREKHASRQRTALRDSRADLPEHFVRVVERATQHQPDDRYQSADALAEALTTLTPRVRVVPLRYALGVAAVLALVVGGAWEIVGRQLGSPRTPSVLLGGLADLSSETAAARHVIAVMPFSNLSAASDDAFVEGLRAEVIRHLATIDGIAVRSSTSSAEKTPGNTRQLGQQLHADLLLEASVLPAGTRIQVNARLIRAADGMLLWSDAVAGHRKDAFAIQGDMSQSIVKALGLKLQPGQRRYDSNLEVYELYLRARGLQARREQADLQVINLLSDVVKRDPGFAPGYAALASVYGNLSYTFPDRRAMTMSPRQAYGIMRSLALEAVRLDRNLPEAHAAMGWVHSMEFEWAEAEQSFERALTLNPKLTTLYTDFVLTTLYPQGKLVDALQQLELARQTEPLSLDVQRMLATIQISAGRYDDALGNCRRVMAIDKDFPYAQMRCDQALMHRGDVNEAIAMMEKFLRGRSDRHTYGYLGCAWALAGRPDDAEAMAAQNPGLPHMQALIYGCLGDANRAFSAIQRLADLNPVRALTFLTRPELVLLRQHQGASALRRKFGLPG